jgi:lichenan operon transcriptional antiterminator
MKLIETMQNRKFSKRQSEILRALLEHKDWITAKRLAVVCDSSERTVKSELKDLTKLLLRSDVPLIAARGKGYRLDDIGHERAHKILEICSTDENDGDISTIRILEYLLNAKEDIDIDELSEHFFMSRSSMEMKLRNIVDLLQDKGNHVILCRRNNQVRLQGEEQYKRSIINHLVINKKTPSIVNLSRNIDGFDLGEMDDINRIVVDALQKNNVRISDVGIIGITTHIIVAINRIKNGFLLEHSITSDVSAYEGVELVIANTIADEVYQKFNIQFSIIEREAIAIYILLKQDSAHENKVRERQLAVGDKKYATIIDQLLDDIKDQFLIDFTTDQDLFVGLVCHIKALVSRFKYLRKQTNPLLRDIKTTYPFVFEIAVYARQQLINKIGIELDESEIGYIALHFGAAIERKCEFPIEQKIKILVIGQIRSSNSLLLLTKLHSLYGDRAIIQGVYSYFDASLNDCDADLVISTVPFGDDKFSCPVITVQPMLGKQDQKRITTFIWQHFNNNVNYFKYMHEELFFPQLEANSAEEVIHLLCKNLFELGYADKWLEDSVIEREVISPTDLNNLIALPHSLEPLGYVTSISIASLTKPILWKERNAQLIFMLTVSSDKKPYLRDFYEMIVTLTEDIEYVKQLVQTKNFEEFMFILKNIQKQEWNSTRL